MKTAGIICECNPFHAGHGYLIQEAKRGGADLVIALMSGCFVQRGDAAIADPFSRAALMLQGGADVVLELPFPFSSGGAEFFASAGVEILDRLGVDELWFGSECGDMERLQRLSLALDDPIFLERYAQSTEGCEGTAQAFFSCLREFCGDDQPCLSNDILAISYLRALRKRASGMKPVTVKRQGSAYRDDKVRDPLEFPSATALRSLWKEEGFEAILPYLPDGAKEILQPCVEKGCAPAELSNAERLVLGHFRLTSPDVLEKTAELSGGLGNRMAELSQRADSLESFLKLSETKKYPDARIRRGILFALTGILREDLRSSPAYVRLLASNEAGREFLAACRKNSQLPIVTRRADLPASPEAQRQAEWERRAYALYSLCLPKAAPCDGLWRQNPIIAGKNFEKSK